MASPAFSLAVISDIHGNIDALKAVLDDIKSHGDPPIYCLGDIVGYGPDPVACVDLVMDKVAKSVLGNHDQGALFDPQGFNSIAEESIMWTRDQLEKSADGRERREARWNFLAELPRSHREADRLFVHASPRNPINEYLFPDDYCNTRKMGAAFKLVDKLCFVGHTHQPGIFVDMNNPLDSEYRFVSQKELGDFPYRIGETKLIVNVGSVGQPRDGNTAACYVLLGESEIHYRRVVYNHKAVADKLLGITEISEPARRSLSDRIIAGK